LHVIVFTQVPSKGGKGSERQLAWVFDKSNADTMALMGLINLPMMSSVIFRKLFGSDSKDSKGTKDVTQTDAGTARDSTAQEDDDNAMDLGEPADGDHAAAKRKHVQSQPVQGDAGQRKTAQKKEQKAAKGGVDKQEMRTFSPMMTGRTADDARPKTALDDFMCAMDFAIVKVATAYKDTAEERGEIKSIETKILEKTKGFCASLFLEFLFEGKVSVNGKMFRIWTALRLELQHIIVSTHDSLGADSGELDPLAMAEKICAQFVSAPVLTMVGDDDEEEAVRRILTVTSLHGETIVQPLAAFVKDTLNLPLWMHAAPQTALLGAKQSSLDTLDLVSFMVLVQDKLMQDLPSSWIALARDVSECFATHGHFIDKTSEAHIGL
jgi:hypothetical protein